MSRPPNIRTIDEPLRGQRGNVVFPHELGEKFVASSGPGGQNVNKNATAVQLRFDVPHAVKLDERTKRRLIEMAGTRASKDGEIIIEAQEGRRQEANRIAARQRLADLLWQASAPPPKKRRKTRPTKGSIERRLKTKSQRGEIKRLRQTPDK
ncbi:alternative ribosome rescue aminoacyl-tRNA hydrolase ArfB [Notoacmeibacter ruber]|uniref:Aminoacyl-tRNA hydrolase n=1 Tax=Notoacmeibacter ruber TaxID=2670375 RepID=A0A3L7JEN2_9HYPH|nr:alternative ribosome rescue aminoacyl-tRNA hydrolase ArfB [Notoacmeibacter ruber]RLQ89227.1 aminoacyl-tRNA hydrolase [Notoacmeibacter ruber]